VRPVSAFKQPAYIASHSGAAHPPPPAQCPQAPDNDRWPSRPRRPRTSPVSGPNAGSPPPPPGPPGDLRLLHVVLHAPLVTNQLAWPCSIVCLRYRVNVAGLSPWRRWQQYRPPMRSSLWMRGAPYWRWANGSACVRPPKSQLPRKSSSEPVPMMTGAVASSTKIMQAPGRSALPGRVGSPAAVPQRSSRAPVRLEPPAPIHAHDLHPGVRPVHVDHHVVEWVLPRLHARPGQV